MKKLSKGKKIAIAVAVLLIIGIAAGGSDEEKETNTGTQTEKSTTKDNTSKDATTSETATIESQEIFNQNGIVITTNGYEPSSLSDPEIKLIIENNSTQNVTIQTRNSSVNGYMIDFQISCEVAAGKKANDTISISRSELNASGVKAVANIEFNFHIFDTDTWDTIVDSEVVTLNTSLSDTHVQEYDTTGNVLFEDGSVRIISKKLVEDDYDTEAILYIENNTDQYITVQARDTSINGFMVDPTMSADIAPGKKAVTDMSFSNTELEENSITSVDSIETSFHIFNTDSFDTIIDTPAITITY